jgi:hypothetical protein
VTSGDKVERPTRTVLGTTSPNSPISMRPATLPPIVMSKKTTSVTLAGMVGSAASATMMAAKPKSSSRGPSLRALVPGLLAALFPLHLRPALLPLPAHLIPAASMLSEAVFIPGTGSESLCPTVQ